MPTLVSPPRRRRPATGDEEASPGTQGDISVAREPAVWDYSTAGFGDNFVEQYGMAGRSSPLQRESFSPRLSGLRWIEARRSIVGAGAQTPAICLSVPSWRRRPTQRACCPLPRPAVKESHARRSLARCHTHRIVKPIAMMTARPRMPLRPMLRIRSTASGPRKYETRT